MLAHLSCRKNESNFALHHCLPLFPAGAAWQGGGAVTPPPAAYSFPQDGCALHPPPRILAPNPPCGDREKDQFESRVAAKVFRKFVQDPFPYLDEAGK